MVKVVLLIAFLIAASVGSAYPVNEVQSAPRVITGLEALIQADFAPLKGKRVGLITNPTGITHDFRSSIDVLFNSRNIKLVALFGPEHGVRGDTPAGATVENAMDRATGLPAFSLYGKTRKPTAAMLKGVDALVFDIQDIGSRSYTYIATLGYCMDAAAEHSIPLFVLDRPNPLGGELIEGNIPEKSFLSIVCPYLIPYCHGLTVGELAQMINAKGWLPGGKQCKLTVIRMKGWRRSMDWKECGLPWVPASPHVPKPDTAAFYAATGIVGELSTMSIGVGYTLPFELAGARGVGPQKLANELNKRKLPNVLFRPMTWQPFYAALKGQPCGGVQIHLLDARHVQPTRLNFEIMDALRLVKPSLNLFAGPASESRMFDMECGTTEVRRMFQVGKSASEIWAKWNSGAAAFRVERKQYLLYE